MTRVTRLICLAGILIFPCRLMAEEPNLVVNPSVEEDAMGDSIPDNWSPSGAGGYWSTEEFHSGTHSIAAREDVKAYFGGWITSVRGLVPGGVYLVSVWGKSSNLAKYAQIWFYWQDKYGETKGGEKALGGRFTGTTGWEKRAVALFVPDDAAGIRIAPFVYSKAGSPGKAWFDDFEVLAIAPAPEGLTKKGGNLLYNGSFEIADPLKSELPLAWLPTKPPASKSILVWETTGCNGRSLSLENRERADLCFWNGISYKFSPDTAYTVSFRYKFTKKEGGSLFVFVPGGLKEVPGPGNRTDLPVDWADFSFTFTTPKDVKTAPVIFSLYQGRAGQKVMIDDVQLTETGSVP